MLSLARISYVILLVVIALWLLSGLLALIVNKTDKASRADNEFNDRFK